MNRFDVQVRSLVSSDVRVMIPVIAPSRYDAEQFALRVARFEEHIPVPIVVREVRTKAMLTGDALLLEQLRRQFGGNEHAAAREFHRLMVELHAPKVSVTELNGNYVPFCSTDRRYNMYGVRR
jgi:hypothetical protein